MAQVEIDDIIEYQRFRKNPGPLLNRVASGRPLLVLKGRVRVVVVDAALYNSLVQQAEQRAGNVENILPTAALPALAESSSSTTPQSITRTGISTLATTGNGSDEVSS